MLYRHNKTFWCQFCNFKHFLKAENSEDSLTSSREEFCISFRVAQYETGLLLELLGTNVANLLWLHWSPVFLYMFIFNLAKLQCKQTVVSDFCIGFGNKIHIIGKKKKQDCDPALYSCLDFTRRKTTSSKTSDNFQTDFIKLLITNLSSVSKSPQSPFVP